jgi:hypothetical protein
MVDQEDVQGFRQLEIMDHHLGYGFDAIIGELEPFAAARRP